MPAARFIRPLSEQEQQELKQLYRKTEQADVRSRCQMILLSAAGQPVAEIAKLTYFSEDAVLYWFQRYESDQLAGLEDRPGRGRPAKSG